MVEYYMDNRKIAIYGSKKEIEAAKEMLDSIPDLDTEMTGFRFVREGKLRLQIQDAMERMPVKADILVDGNTVYPYSPIIKEFRRLKKSGTLEKMTNRFYQFLHLNFDIAHYNKQGYINTYGNSFREMYKQVLANARTPGWHTDLQRILNTIWAEMGIHQELEWAA